MAGNSTGTAKRKQGGIGKPFQKGVSGNPSGRPKNTQEQKDALVAIKELAPTAAKMLEEIITDRKAPTASRVKAIEIILNRTYGMPNASIKLESFDFSALDAVHYGNDDTGGTAQE